MILNFRVFAHVFLFVNSINYPLKKLFVQFIDDKLMRDKIRTKGKLVLKFKMNTLFSKYYFGGIMTKQ